MHSGGRMAMDFYSGYAYTVAKQLSTVKEKHMHETFLYQNTFETLNVPDEDRAFITRTRSLFDAAHKLIDWNDSLFMYTTKQLESDQASQLFLEHENNDEHYYDRVALTAQPRHFVIGLEHKNFNNYSEGYRSSLSIYGGVSRAYFSDVAGYQIDNGTTERQSIEDFKNRFDAVVAAMSLFGTIKRLDLQSDQNESVAATFAKAA